MDDPENIEKGEANIPRRKSCTDESGVPFRCPYPDLENDYPFYLHPSETQTTPLLQSPMQENGNEDDDQLPTVQRSARKSSMLSGDKMQQGAAKVQFANDGKTRIVQDKPAPLRDRPRSSARGSLSKRRPSRRYSVVDQPTVGGKICAIWRNIYTVLALREWFFFFVLVGYAILGGLLFSWIERDHTHKTNEELVEKLEQDRERVSSQIFSIMNEPWRYPSHAEQKRAVTDLLEKYQYKNGLGPKAKPQWDLWDGVFYSFTVFTTIGYGHYTPVTKLGRLATILYALIGIPLLLAILADFGRLLTRALKRMWSALRNGIRRVLAMRRFRKLQEAAKKAGLDTEEEVEIDGIADEEGEFNFPIPLAVFMIISWMFICSAFFLIWETNWSYFDAFYFFFISLSTIGLGDIVPEHQKFMIANFPFVLIGLSLVTLVINLIQNKIEEMKEKAENALEDQLGLEYSESEDEEVQTEFGPDDKIVDEGGETGEGTVLTPKAPRSPKRERGQQRRGSTKAKRPGQVNLGIIQTYRLPKTRRRVGTQTEESFMRDKKGRTGPDRYSLLTGNSEYFDAQSLLLD